MNLTITIDDKEFEDAVSKGLKDIDKDQMNQIVMSALTEYMKKSDVLDNLLFVKSGFYSSSKEPSEILKSSIQAALKDNEEIKDFGRLIVYYLKENYQKVLMDALVLAFMRNLKTDEFIDQIRISLSTIIDKIMNPTSDSSPTIYF